jgi:predicted phage tail protein
LALAWRNTYAGGEPTSLMVDVTGSVNTSVPLTMGDTVSFAGVPSGTYTLALRGVNGSGPSAPSAPLTVTVPGACSGPPLPVENFLAYRVGNTINVLWDPPATGAAPTGYVLNVSGAWVGGFSTSSRSLSSAVPPGTYALSVSATNTCGASAFTAVQTVVVP